MSDVKLIGLTKKFGSYVAVQDTNLHIKEGEFFSLLGPSGCGKSTTLRMIAGFVKPTAGEILLGGEDVTYVPPEKREIGIVFQNYAIFPHMNVFENIAFGLRLRRVSESEIARTVSEVLEQVGLSGYETRFQKELSGGQQQRVALARVLVTRPKILLLDEPLSALDKKLREEMKVWIKDLQRRLSITTIYVTHDQGEALTMSDRIGVMNKSQIVQIGAPEDIYERPDNLFVTRFIGESNVLDAEIGRLEDGYAFVKVGDSCSKASISGDMRAGETVSLVIRPENVLLDVDDESHCGFRAQMTVIDHTYQGSLLRYRLRWGNEVIACDVQNQAHREILAPGSNVSVGWGADRALVLPSHERDWTAKQMGQEAA